MAEHDRIGNTPLTIRGAGSGKENLIMIADQLASPATYAIAKEMKVDPMWSAEEDERRAAIIRRASEGARKALRGK